MKRGDASHSVWLVVAAIVAASLPLAARAATTSLATPDSPFYATPFITPIPPGQKMLVEADQLVYDLDRKTVAAVGHVRIYYGQYTLTAERVTYNQDSGRLVADGNVVLVDPIGTEFRSTHIDITANFRDAFVASLKVETPQQTHFSAESAQRTDGDIVTFQNAAYTACETCIEQPDKPPLWNIKATTIVLNQKEHTVSFTDARLEFLGMPIARFRYFTVPDQTVTRKSGFLWPTASYSGRLGVGLGIPYFWAIAPSYDLTFTPSVYSRQGFLGDVEWRQRLENGQYSLEMAGIDQRDKSAFLPTSASYRDLRGGLRTIGDFEINPRWDFGWDGTLLSDRTFTRDYHVLSGDNSLIVSTAHLTGVGTTNFFEARASAYTVLTEKSAAPVVNPGKFDQGRQAYAAPVVDYRRVNDSAAGGELTMTSNLTTVVRPDDDPFQVGPPFLPGTTTYYTGTAGTTLRATQEVAWQRQSIGAMGQVITPFAYVRGDAYFLTGQTAQALADTSLTGESTAYRAMPAAGLEVSYPMLVRGASATQIIEPKAQLILRPNEMGIGTVPNNDAQSLVYGVANLFDWDKFSGDDRNEGGGRLNVGVHYNGQFANGAAIDGTFGQSFQVLGRNSFATADIADVGPYSGLETRRSDYVGALSVNSGIGPSVSVSGRFDDKTLAVNRAELQATAAMGPVTASAAYFFLRQDPNNDAAPGRASVVHGAASVSLTENWRAFGSVAYDIAKAAIASNSVGFAFDNSCLTFAVTYNQTFKNYTDLKPDRQLNFRLELRTLGQVGAGAKLNSL